MPQEADAIIHRILILTTLAIAQTLSAASDSHSHPCFSCTLSKYCDVKEYMDMFLFMNSFFFFFWSVYYLVSRPVSQSNALYNMTLLALFTIGLTSPCMLKGHPDYLLVVDVE